MKKNWIKYLIGVIIFLGLIAVYAVFRSIPDKATYLNTFDQILSNIIQELWKLLSTPSVFIALLVVTLLLFFKEKILLLLPAIKEIKAGSFSAILDYPTDKSEHLEDKADKSLQSTKIKNDNKIIEDYLLNKLDNSMLRVLHDIDKKSLTINEFRNIMQQFGVEKKKLDRDNLNDRDYFHFYYGLITIILGILSPTILQMKISNDKQVASFKLSSGIRNKIHDLLKAQIGDNSIL